MDRSRGIIESYCSSLEETIELGKKIGKAAAPSTIFCLFGDLGAGKTSLVKGIAAGVSGINIEEVSSPTFVYLNIYNGRLPIYHFDLYRLLSSTEFLAMGFDEYLFAEGVTCIEWSERISSLLPLDVVNIDLVLSEDGGRRIKIENNGKIDF